MAKIIDGKAISRQVREEIAADVVEFKRKYILETVDWYLDFSREIKVAVKTLADSLETPISELSFLYTPIESWKI